MLTERELQISPIVQESVLHNTKTLTTLHNLTASLFGVGAGILGLESYSGFIFYLVFSLLISALVYAFRVRPAIIQDSKSGGTTGLGVETYFRGSMELWTGGLFDGLSGFVLTWTLFYGLVLARIVLPGCGIAENGGESLSVYDTMKDEDFIATKYNKGLCRIPNDIILIPTTMATDLGDTGAL
ncbi:ER membrane protein complex subunit [Lachnellula suecica]|uniref:ER membrane protein complex subunit 6 n=1 Tax=Lachnellula suecica TaxID=602035 RepID=A0A8T9CBR1_9HELO|nr:ER membrane protein complex subunit [Lachnellula suecica]